MIAFRGATLIDGTSAPPVPDALLVVADGRIAYAGPPTAKALADLPAGAETVALPGRWIVPGLVDAHVHAESDADLEQMLRWGVTAVRLMAEDVAAARETARRAARPGSRMPDVFPSAPIFAAKGGWWGRGEPADSHLDRFPATPAAARAAVVEAKSLGSTEIKLMLDDMAWCRAPLPPLPKLDPAVARALIQEARRQGMRAIVHAPERADAEAAMADGATALAHGVLEPLEGAEILGPMKSRPVDYVPTMDLFEFLADPRAFVDAVLADPVTTAPGGLPPDTIARLRSPEYDAIYRERYPNSANVKRCLPALYDNLRRLHAAGVPVALGTDMWAFPGLAVSVEMGLYVKAGLTPLEALRAGTYRSARSLGIDADHGTLESGKRADFLVLDADPLADVKNVRRIGAVYKRGERVGP